MKKQTKYIYPKFIKELSEKADGLIKHAYHEGIVDGLKQAQAIMKGFNKKAN